ncbi:MAG: MMPL family transporter [Proteobacteria bacterium]|nr:MMPL family transporter [Pseudomonadota bacterium]
MTHWIARLATSRPRTIYLFVALLTLGLGLQIPSIEIDTDPENMLPQEQPDRVFHNQTKEEFGLSDAIVVGAVNDDDPGGIYNVRSLAAMHRVSREILKIDGVVRHDLMSLSVVDNVSQDGVGAISFDWLMHEAPQTAKQALAIREAVERLPLLMNTLVSGDGKTAAIYVPIVSKDQSYRISGEIEQIIDRSLAESGATDSYHITGLPVAEDTFGYEMFVQMGISAPLAGLAIFLLMWFFFRNAALVVAPMIVAMATVISAMGLMIGMGYTVHIMSSMIPIFLMPIAVVDSVHILSEFADTFDEGDDAGVTIRKVVGRLFRPMLFTSVTSIIGFLSLALTPIPPVQIFGIFVGFGIMLAFLLTIVFVPAYVVRMSPAQLRALQKSHRGRGKPGMLSRLLPPLGRFSTANSVKLVIAFVVVFGLSVLGVTRIQINDNPVNWFKSDHRIRVADEALNRHFAGTYDAFLVLRYQGQDAYRQLPAQAEEILDRARRDGVELDAIWQDVAEQTGADDPGEWLDAMVTALDDALFGATDVEIPYLEDLLESAEAAQSQAKYFQQPEAVRLIETLQQVLVASVHVGKTNALPDLVKTVNRELLSGAPSDFAIPDTTAAIAQTLLVYQSSHRPNDLWHMVTPDYRSAVIWLQLRSGDNQDMSEVMEQFDEYLAGHPLPADLSSRWAGKTYINVVWQDAMVAGMVKSLLGAFVVVLIMMIVLFRSFFYGLLAMLPLTITITLIYGLIGFIGKDYDMPIAVLSALTLGLSVDFAIHFLERARAIHQETGSFALTMNRVFKGPARAITRNTIVVAIGFTPLLFSPLLPYVTVGAFLAGIMAVSAIVTLVLLPAMLSILRGRLLPEPHRSGGARKSSSGG